MAKHSAERVGARLDTSTSKALVRFCAANGCTTSVALRSAIAKLSDRSPDAEIADLCKLLGLPPDADPSAILDAVNALLNAAEPPSPTAETADPAPKALTKLEREYCAREKLSQTEFRARKAGAVKRAPNRKAAR